MRMPEGMPGVGVDLVEIARLEASLERGGQSMLDRMFTPAEQQECQRRKQPAMHYAARMAAKEAGMKALGTGWTGGVSFCDFEVISDGKTAPKLKLHGVAKELAQKEGISSMRLSISHTDNLAIAFVIAEMATQPNTLA
ncbi:MAG: holo-ACP synthase [Planctomycetes bacterium]|nr:holo-ACP synthase [Planctomycetota bacterium]